MRDAVGDHVVVAGREVYTVYVDGDCLHRSSAVGSVDEACAFGPEVAAAVCCCWSVVLYPCWAAFRLDYPRDFRQLGPADEILVRGVGTRRRGAVEESAVRGGCGG